MSVHWNLSRRDFGFLILATLLSGCSGKNPVYSVRTDVASDTLKSALDAWKAGKTPADLQYASPAITVQDMDWSGESKLIGYEIQPGAESVDANLIAKVKLSIETRNGKKEDKTVTYMVGTDPALTVFRHMLP
jgi:hypothetical protein